MRQESVKLPTEFNLYMWPGLCPQRQATCKLFKNYSLQLRAVRYMYPKKEVRYQVLKLTLCYQFVE